MSATPFLFSYGRIKGDSGYSLSLRERPAVNFGRVGILTKPTSVQRGAFTLFSFPIYNNDDEEIYINWNVNRRYNGLSDVTFGCYALYDTAQATPTEYTFRLEWNHYDYTKAVVPSTVKTVHFTQRASASQYAASPITFTIDYDADGAGNEIKTGETVGIRIYRVSRTNSGTTGWAETSGEVMLHGFYVQFNIHKLGT